MTNKYLKYLWNLSSISQSFHKWHHQHSHSLKSSYLGKHRLPRRITISRWSNMPESPPAMTLYDFPNYKPTLVWNFPASHVGLPEGIDILLLYQYSSMILPMKNHSKHTVSRYPHHLTLFFEILHVDWHPEPFFSAPNSGSLSASTEMATSNLKTIQFLGFAIGKIRITCVTCLVGGFNPSEQY